MASNFISRWCPLWIVIDARNRFEDHPFAQSPRSPLASSSAEQQTEENGTAAGCSFPRYAAACGGRGVLALQVVPHTLDYLPRTSRTCFAVRRRKPLPHQCSASSCFAKRRRASC